MGRGAWGRRRTPDRQLHLGGKCGSRQRPAVAFLCCSTQSAFWEVLALLALSRAGRLVHLIRMDGSWHAFAGLLCSPHGAT